MEMDVLYPQQVQRWQKGLCMAEIDARLREEVRQLGELLGETISTDLGEALLEKIEVIRKGAKAARQGSSEGARLLQTSLDQLSEAQVLPVTRAFNQF